MDLMDLSDCRVYTVWSGILSIQNADHVAGLLAIFLSETHSIEVIEPRETKPARISHGLRLAMTHSPVQVVRSPDGFTRIVVEEEHNRWECPTKVSEENFSPTNVHTFFQFRPDYVAIGFPGVIRGPHMVDHTFWKIKHDASGQVGTTHFVKRRKK